MMVQIIFVDRPRASWAARTVISVRWGAPLALALLVIGLRLSLQHDVTSAVYLALGLLIVGVLYVLDYRIQRVSYRVDRTFVFTTAFGQQYELYPGEIQRVSRAPVWAVLAQTMGNRPFARPPRSAHNRLRGCLLIRGRANFRVIVSPTHEDDFMAAIASLWTADGPTADRVVR